MATKTNNVVDKSVVDTLEQLFQRAVIDLEFRRELLLNPEEFGISVDTEDLVLPTPVAKQDMSFVELIKDAKDFGACADTCVTGFTILCDGNSVEPSTGCRCTCVTGYTVLCDGRTL